MNISIYYISASQKQCDQLPQATAFPITMYCTLYSEPTSTIFELLCTVFCHSIKMSNEQRPNKDI